MPDSTRRLKRSSGLRAVPGRDASVLWVGPVEMIHTLPDSLLAHALPDISRVRELASIQIRDLSQHLQQSEAPDAILSPLFWRGGDGVETARMLHAAGFRNPYRIIAPRLPRPELVLREIRLSYPDLDIDMIASPTRERNGRRKE